MLAARRDPILDQGSHEDSLSPQPNLGTLPPASTPAFTRFIAGVQILGTVLAIPLGLASGYSIYRANFSPEAHCSSLRANIISMLDKNADASTLRLLVRRDVATFENSCAAVDPDAVAAFKTLLVKPHSVAVTKPAEPVKAERRQARAAHPERVAHGEDKRAPARRVEATVGTKVGAKNASAVADARQARHKADADWLAAVRRALVDHVPVTRAQAAEAPAQFAPPPTGQPTVRPMGQPPTVPAQADAAPPLPPATAVVDAPAPKSDPNHPVPPALIPNVGPPPSR